MHDIVCSEKDNYLKRLKDKTRLPGVSSGLLNSLRSVPGRARTTERPKKGHLPTKTNLIWVVKGRGNGITETKLI